MSTKFGYTGDTPPIVAQASGVDFVYVASIPQPGKSNAILVRDDAKINALADLRGKKIALVKGSSAHNVLVQVLKKAGVAWGSFPSRSRLPRPSGRPAVHSPQPRFTSKMTTTAHPPHSVAALSVRRLAPALGAVIEGIDLAHDLDAETIAAIRAALDEHLVLFFERQTWTPEQQRDFAGRFGELYVHPLYPGQAGLPEIMILEYDAHRRGHNDVWHSDVSYIATPPQASILTAEILPPLGGDTLWANTYLAYEALSEPLKTLADGLHAVHDFARAFRPERFAEYGIADRADKAYADNPPVTHPVVRTNPATGRKALFVNANFTSHIVGVSARESTALLNYFTTHVTQPEFQVRWRWTPGAVAFWDNRWTQHYALADYYPEHRRMRRATILGDRPV
jgi:taurine dioxygenase